MNTTAPQWVSLANYSKYEFSSEGLVRNKKTGRIKKPYLAGNYWRQCLIDDEGDKKQWRLCRLIATAFNLPKRDDQNQVDHINGDAKDDRVCNLRWRTAKENMADRITLKGTVTNNKRVYLKFESDTEILYFSSINESCRHFDRVIGTMWAIYKMAEFKGSQKWRGYTVTIIKEEDYNAA